MRQAVTVNVYTVHEINVSILDISAAWVNLIAF